MRLSYLPSEFQKALPILEKIKANRTLMKETLARFPIMEEREISAVRFFAVDFLP